MKLFLLTLITMVAFAANSLLNRAALQEGDISPDLFAVIRLGAGVAVLFLLVLVKTKQIPKVTRPDIAAVAGLTAYMLGFSFAYLQLDAGLGALILFALVQMTMFSGAVLSGEKPPFQRWMGMGISLAGLALLFWPSETLHLPLLPVLLMVAAGIGWGLYSLAGRNVTNPLLSTAWNFLYALPIALIVYMVVGDTALSATHKGFTLAIISGAITSALGYALWYQLIPKLGASRAALSQLSVPVIALILGALLLNEAISSQAMLSCTLILGGIAFGLRPSKG